MRKATVIKHSKYFTRGKVYEVRKDYMDLSMVKWFIVQRDDGNKAMIHEKDLRFVR